MSKHFETVLRKYISEAIGQDVTSPLTPADIANSEKQLNTASPAVKKAAQTAAQALTPAKPFEQMSPVEQLQSIIDPTHPENDISKVSLTPELDEHLKKVGINIGNPSNSQTTPSASQEKAGSVQTNPQSVEGGTTYGSDKTQNI
jgi:hypothetical protein